nr:response regulator [Aliikangiella sp. G2MR2-5]
MVFIVEDDEEQSRVLENLVVQSGFRAKCFFSTEQFKKGLLKENSELPNVVLMDLNLEGNHYAGIEAIQNLTDQQRHTIPIIVVSVEQSQEARLAAFKAGASRYICKPFDPDTLIEGISMLAQKRPQKPIKVLMVDDDKFVLEIQSLNLAQVGIEVEELSDPTKALDLLESFRPDVIVLDVYMPKIMGPELASMIRLKSEYLDIPIIFLSSEEDPIQQINALRLGGDDFLVKPVDGKHLVSMVTVRAFRYREIKATKQRLEKNLYELERIQYSLDEHAIVSTTDRRGNIIAVNERFCNISGYSKEELIGQNHRILKSGVHSSDFYQSLWSCISSGKTWHGEICNRRKDGSLYWVSSTITPFLDNEGKPYRYTSIRTNITETKQHQFALQALVENMVAVTDKNFFQRMMEGLAKTCQVDSCFFAIPTEKTHFKMLAYWDNSNLVKSYKFDAKGTPIEYLLEQKTYLCSSGMSESFSDIQWANTNDIESFIGVRLINRKGESIGVIGIMDKKVIHDPRNKLAILKIFASRIENEIERRSSEQVLQRFRETLDQTLDAVFIADAKNLSFTYVNQGALKLLGYTREEIFSILPDEILVNVSKEQMVNLANSMRLGELSTFRKEAIVKAKDGRKTPVEIFLQYIGSHGAESNLVAIVRDISERKNAEEILKESESRLDFLISETPVTLFTCDKNPPLKMTWISSNIKKQLGYSPKIFIESQDFWLDRIHPDDRKKLEDDYSKLMQAGTYQREYRILDASGQYSWVMDKLVLIKNELGEPQEILGYSINIDERKRAEEEMLISLEEARKANQAKSDFLSNMSHELRTPMNAIIGFNQLILNSKSINADEKECAQEVEKAGKHLLSLINDVLDLAKVESGKIDLTLEPVSVRKTVEDCMKLVSPLAQGKNIEIRYDSIGSGTVWSDRVRLRQVLLNLLSNAIKYNKKNGSVELKLDKKENGETKILIIDTGLGIAKNRIGELFQPFNRLEAENSSIEGTGIGLALVRSIVEQMGGSVGVESEAGVGSTFWITLPEGSLSRNASRRSNLSYQNIREKTTATSSMSHGHKQHKVLYIEDNPANLKLVEKIIQANNDINLLSSPSPELGIEIAISYHPDLILLDINLPGMDGYQVLDELKNNELTSNIPVIAITANAMQHDIERGKKAGFVDYLIKPIDVKQFKQKLSQFFG